MSDLRASLTPRLTDAAFAAGWTFLPWIPRQLSAPLFRGAAAAAARRPGAFDQLRRNLRQVVGPDLPEPALDELVVQGVQSYARYWHEAFLLPGWDPAKVIARTEVHGVEHVLEPFRAGRGTVVALSHSGNWDAAAVVIVHGHGIPMTTVAERLKPESLFRRFRDYRVGLGMTVAALSGDDMPSTAVLKQALRRGEMITLLADRNIIGNGIPVHLCGRATTLPSGPALMALQTGAALIPLELSFTPDGWRMEYHPEIPMPGTGRIRERVTAGITELADVLTGFITRSPHDWHMLQRIWPDV